MYSDVQMESEPTDSVWIEPCYTVLFMVKDSNDQPIDNADITFNQQTKTTDFNGEAFFSLVDNDNNQDYTISADGYQQYQNVISVESDTTLEVYLDTLDTGIEEAKDKTISITPNPVNAEATIHHLSNDQYTVEIYEITGKSIKTININGGLSTTINLSFLKPGMYFLIIRNDNGDTHRLKIIKRTEN